LAASVAAHEPELVAKVDAAVNDRTVTGHRYSPALQASIDTEG